MQENTTRAIVVNSLVMYLRLAVTAVAGLLTTRYALQALGANDFGIFSVVGGVVSLITVVNAIMVSTSSRFISVAVGRGDDSATNRIFNVCLMLHAAIALLLALVAIPAGRWYISEYVNFDGNIAEVIRVFNITILWSLLSFVGVPYNGLLMAKEKFVVFSLVEILFSVAKALVTYSLLWAFDDKLYVYALTVSICACAPTLAYMLYCHVKWPSLTRWRIVRDGAQYREVLLFSRWVGFGAVAQIGQAQGATLLVNSFFSAVMNAAQGVAASIKALVMMMAQNLTRSISPQITKAYVAGNHDRCRVLMAASSKFSFFVMLVVSAPFMVDVEFILRLWLGSVPAEAPRFVYLMIVDSLIFTFNMGVSEVIFANGNIRNYQLVINSLILLSIVAAYVVLRLGAPAYSLYYVYIAVSVINTFLRQWILHRTVGYDSRYLVRNAYLPSLAVVLLFVPILFVEGSLHPVAVMAVAEAYLCFLIFFVGLSRDERRSVVSKMIRLCQAR